MTVHLLKLSVGSESVDSLRAWQASRREHRRRQGETAEVWHRTRMFPKRRNAVLDGGSIYWVIKGVIQARQRITELRSVTGEDGIKRCDIVLDPELVLVRPTPRRAFQGWRYLNPESAPPDLGRGEGAALADLPPRMRAELLELGLI